MPVLALLGEHYREQHTGDPEYSNGVHIMLWWFGRMHGTCPSATREFTASDIAVVRSWCIVPALTPDL